MLFSYIMSFSQTVHWLMNICLPSREYHPPTAYRPRGGHWPMTRHMSTLPCPPHGCATSEQKTLFDDLTRPDTAVSVADCTMSEQNILNGEMTHADTAVSTTGYATSEQKTLVDDLTRSDTAVSVADCTMFEQNILNG